MAGIYIHIPFCKSRCIYCGFYSTTALDLRQRYVDDVCREMELRGDRGKQLEEKSDRKDSDAESIDTIYLGGGTPSQLTIEQLHQIFDALASHFSFLNFHLSPLTTKEITIEVNPDDVTADYAAALSQLPVNRVSMGAQTFDDTRLRFLHRRHSAAQVPLAVQRLRDAGFRNISVDLMYGFPGETLNDWQRDIDAALSLDVEHLSAYCLMVEEGTVLFEKMRNGENEKMRNGGNERMRNGENEKMRECDEELERQMYEMLIDRLESAGFEHYEISNFAKKTFRSRHNSCYWTGVPYIGLGAAAHSYDGKGRQWNVSNILQYMESIERGVLPYEREELDDDTRYNDRIVTALRTREGLSLSLLSPHYRQHLLASARRFIDSGLLICENGNLHLSRNGLFVSDMVMSELLLV